MIFAKLIDAIEGTGVAAWVREDAFSFPLLDAVHVASVMLVFGSIAFLDLRLLGVAARGRTTTGLSREVLPWTWAGFLAAAVSGALLMSGQAGAYIANRQFQLKLLLMLAAAINMLIFHLVAWRRVDQWDVAQPPPAAARVAGALSLLLWIAVVVCGRWVGWTLGASPF